MVFIASWFSISTGANAGFGDQTISSLSPVGPTPITIKTCSHDAGAICSLKWNNKEFVNDYDHGRQIQSAMFFAEGNSQINIPGGINNPTEAGAGVPHDAINPSPSSSSLMSITKSATNIISTQTNMAYWDPNLNSGQVLSNHILNKQVTIGVYGIGNAIQYLTTFTSPVKHTSVQFEAVAAYLADEFTNFYSLDVKNNQLVPQQISNLTLGTIYDSGVPIIATTLPVGKSTLGDNADFSNYAIGFYSPQLPYTCCGVTSPNSGYSYVYFPNKLEHLSAKLSVLMRNYNNPSGVPTANSFESYIVVGTSDNVRIALYQLHQARP